MSRNNPISKNFFNDKICVNNVDISNSEKNFKKMLKKTAKTRFQKQKTKTRLKALTWNCNGIINKIDSLKVLIQKEKPEIIALNEIKCTDEEANGELFIPGYDSIVKCRTSKGGGVALLINEKIKFNPIKVPLEIDEEIIGITIKLQKVKISIFTIYIPAHKKLIKKSFDFIQKFEIHLIMGDLNAKVKELNTKPKQNGIHLSNILCELKAAVVFNKNYPNNFHRKNGNDSSLIIDLIIISSLISPHFKNCVTIK